MNFTAALALALLCATALPSCDDTVTQQALPPGFRQDVFAQEAASRIDVLWVIDNSASMLPHQQELAVSLTRFMELFSRGLVDYRIAVTTADVLSDHGEFLGSPAVIDPKLPDPVGAFQRNVQVGTGGKGHEEAFEAARLAIEREKAAAEAVLNERAACIGRCPATGLQQCIQECETRNTPRFMRPDTHLYLVFVSDENEQSFGEVQYFQRYFKGALGVGNEASVGLATICGDVNTAPTCPAEPGTRYAELVSATGGIIGSICDETFDRHLERLALDAVGLKRKFALAEIPDLETLQIEVRYRCDTQSRYIGRCAQLLSECAGKGPEHQGLLCTPPQGEIDGWTYEPSTNAVFFHGAAVPGLRSAVVVSYEASDEPRTP